MSNGLKYLKVIVIINFLLLQRIIFVEYSICDPIYFINIVLDLNNIQ